MGNLISHAQSAAAISAPSHSPKMAVISPAPQVIDPLEMMRITAVASMTPAQYDLAVTQLEMAQQHAERIQSYITRDTWLLDGKLTEKKRTELEYAIQGYQHKLDILAADIHTQQQKIAAVKQYNPEITRRYPGKKRITVTLHYKNEEFPVFVDINDPMNQFLKHAQNAMKTPIAFNPLLIISERFRLFQDGREVVLPPQRWLIPYEEKASLHYDIVITPLLREQKENMAMRLRAELSHQGKVIGTTDEELVASYDEWFIRDTSLYTKSDPSREKRYVAQLPEWEPGQVA